MGPAVLRELAESLGIGEPECIADDDERAFVTFVGAGQGREVGLFALLTRGSEGTYSAVDLYGPALAVREAGPRPSGRL